MLGSCSLIEAKGVFSVLFPPSFSEKGNRGPAIRESLFFGAGCRLEGFWKRLVPASYKQSALQSPISSSPLLFLTLSASAFRSQGRSID